MVTNLNTLIYNLFNIQSETHNADLIDRVKDASRFVLYHQVPIRCWPLQVYASALIFSPVESRTRIQYEDQQPQWITQKPDMEYQWSPCLQTLEEHSSAVSSVLFSQDSRFLASTSWDRTIKIWDTRSGECLNTLDPKSGIDCMALSRDSKVLVSLSHFRTDQDTNGSKIQLWDTDHSNCIMTIEDGDSVLTSVALYEPDYIICGSENGTIKFWNTKSRKCFKVLKGHESKILTATISQNLDFLASVSGDAVKIWDICSGKCVQTLKRPILSDRVIISPDSLLLASVEKDYGFTLRDTKSWTKIQADSPLIGWWSPRVPPFLFSHDSKMLARASESKNISLRSTTTGQLLQTFKGHRGIVLSLAFSHDSKLLASASEDNTIQIWDTTNRQPTRDFDKHDSDIEPCFSPDFTMLATVDLNLPFNVKIWDIHSGRCLQSLNDWGGDRVSTMFFSRDLKHLATESSGQKVRVWDISSGQCLQLFEVNRPGCWGKRLLHGMLELVDGSVSLSSHFVEGLNYRDHKASACSELDELEGLGMSKDGACITWDNECLLWLPLEYRPNGGGQFLTDGVVVGSRLLISCASGRILLFNFDSSAVSKLVATSRAKEQALFKRLVLEREQEVWKRCRQAVSKDEE